MLTIKQLAKLADVSVSTVSNVLNGRHHKMKPETYEKVSQIIAENNYVANMGARMLVQSGSRIIGVFVTYTRLEERDAIQDPFFSELIGSLEREIREAGYYMMLYTTQSVEESLKSAAGWNVAGIIVQGCIPSDCEKYLKNGKFPVVFIDLYHEPISDAEAFPYVNVGLHDYEGGAIIAEYLAESGHKKAAYLSDGSPMIGVDLERAKGFCDKFNEMGGSFDMIADCYTISYKHTKRYEYLRCFAERDMKKYTALFFASDFYAVDAINFFDDIGIKVPKDISVAGFDDNIFSVQCRPRLTTIRQEVSQKSVFAVKLLQDLINDEINEKVDIKLPVSLRVRDSVLKLKH